MKTQAVSNVQRIKEIAHKKYQSRISAVKNFCANKRYKISKVERNNAANLTTRWRQEMWWDIRNGFAWCCVYKVASSSLGIGKIKFLLLVLYYILSLTIDLGIFDAPLEHMCIALIRQLLEFL